MIGFLRGTLANKKAPDLMLDVQGVGYELQASMMTFAQLPELNQEVTLHTHLSIREDAHVLFGFAKTDERDLFRILLKVNGVGPKMALAILSTLTVEAFSRYVHDDDITALTKIPGVGKKTAERLIIDMRDRLPAPTNESLDPQQTSQITTTDSKSQREQAAIDALIALGYKPNQAGNMIKGLDTETLSTEDLIRQALKSSLK